MTGGSYKDGKDVYAYGRHSTRITQATGEDASPGARARQAAADMSRLGDLMRSMGDAMARMRAALGRDSQRRDDDFGSEPVVMSNRESFTVHGTPRAPATLRYQATDDEGVTHDVIIKAKGVIRFTPGDQDITSEAS